MYRPPSRLFPTVCAVVGVVWTGVTTGAGLYARRHHRLEAARQQGMRETMACATPLLEAIRAYEKREGKPPESLGALRFPIPSAGAMAEQRLDTVHGWDYRAAGTASDNWCLLVWVRADHSPNSGFGDCFAYYSDGIYPVHSYGGVLERVGAWGYYWE